MAARILSKIFGMTTAINGHDLFKSNIFKMESIECSFSFEWLHHRISPTDLGMFLSVDPKTDSAFLSANPNPDFWSGESFLKKD